MNSLDRIEKPDWLQLRDLLVEFRELQAIKETDVPRYMAHRDKTFVAVYQALQYIAHQVVKVKNPADVDFSDAVMEIVNRKLGKKTFTDVALEYKPELGYQFNTFVSKIMSNALEDYLNSAKYRHLISKTMRGELDELTKEIVLLEDCRAMGQKPESAEESYDKERLAQAFSKLPLEMQQALMHDHKEMTQQAAATQLGLSLATYKRRRDMGKRLLRINLGLDTI